MWNPRRAGKSLFCFTAAVPIQDHPRMGGEKVTGLAAPTIEPGSPPHRRGKASSGMHGVIRPGITPA